MPDSSPIDVADTLGELHQVTKLSDLDTSGTGAGTLGQVHPIAWAGLGLLLAAVIFHLLDTDWLLGNLSWWHWIGLIAITALAVRPGPIKAVSNAIDGLTDFIENGANHFAHPWAAFATLVVAFGFAGLLIAPLQGPADWVFGVDIVSVGGGDFDITSSGIGWIRTAVAAAIVGACLYALNRALKGVLPDGDISILTGALMAIVTFFATIVIVGLAGSWSTGITAGFAMAVLIAGLALATLWTIAWGIFFTIFFYVVTRYTARFIESDIIIGEVNSLGLNLFGTLALLGLGYGVKAGINPRIDFWWAEFSNRRKAWLDFVLHAVLLVPFLWAALRLLHSYAKTNLGFKTDFSGATDGSWPAGWHVWESWKQAPDAGNLPTGPLRAMILVGFVLFILQIFAEMIKSGFVMIRREDLAELTAAEAPTRVE